jgi:hypothetical protein
MATKALMTVEQFANMKTADNEAYELVDGELIPLPGATPCMVISAAEPNSSSGTTSTGTPLAERFPTRLSRR